MRQYLPGLRDEFAYRGEASQANSPPFSRHASCNTRNAMRRAVGASILLRHIKYSTNNNWRAAHVLSNPDRGSWRDGNPAT
jgi:hypothetical protein